LITNNTQALGTSIPNIHIPKIETIQGIN